MKYIKTFENELYNKPTYWLLTSDDRFEKSLKQIKCPNNNIKIFLNNNRIKNIKYVFICYSPYNKQWEWNSYKGKLLDDYLEENNYKFGGSININEFELDADKFNL